MKAFIDIGGWNGVSAEFFLKNHPQASKFEIFTFECDKRNIEIIKKKKLPITLIEKAAWIYNGKVKFHFAHAGTRAGGTMYPAKKTGHVTKDFYEVECIDIAEFVSQFTDSYIIMKLNCEGAEYNIVSRLMETGLLPRINKWFVQWHWDKIGMRHDEHYRIASMIESYAWDCQFNGSKFKQYFLQAL